MQVNAPGRAALALLKRHRNDAALKRQERTHTTRGFRDLLIIGLARVTCYNSTMHRVVPELILENYRAGRFSGEFQAVGMFLDLSGFSTMTDSLMQHGQHGAEVLAGLMRGVFDPLVESIFNYGGKVVSFAGDGILAFFPIEADGDVDAAAMRALASAWTIQQRFKNDSLRQTIYGDFSFSAKIGLSLGAVKWRILRSEDGSQATYYFRGSAVEDSAFAEHSAKAGEIILTDPLNDLLGDAIRAEPLRDALHRLKRIRAQLPRAVPSSLSPPDLEIARIFAPEEVLVRDARGEFRQSVNLFMRIPDLPDEKLTVFIQKVFELKRKYGGLLSRLDFGDKGCNLLMLWGAPVAYENDIGRALNFVLELRGGVDFPVTAGVTYYIAHAGYLGSRMCEDYTCYGWGVNLASRFMMNAAAGEIWVDERIARRVSARFDIEYIGSQRFKGFAAEQKVNILRGRKQEVNVVYSGEIVGREKELDALCGYLKPLQQGRFAGVYLVVGDAGIGKGRLMHEFMRTNFPDLPHILWAVCHSDQILRQSFNSMRSWLMKYFGIAPHDSAQERRAAFDARFEDLLSAVPESDHKQDLERARSFLAALVDVYWEGSLYETLDAESRHNNTFLALIALLKVESARRPVVLLFEDLHFADPDSIQFLVRLKRAVLAEDGAHPIAIVITSRPQGAVHTLEPDLVDRRLDLTGLDDRSISRLAEILLGGSAAPPLVSLLTERSEGNPYFIEQIVRYLQEENLLEMSRSGWTYVKRLHDIFLPGDIRAVLVSRLDQLSADVRMVVQTASVLGREFDVRALAAMLQMEKEINTYLVQAERAAIWIPRNRIRFAFSHALLRDAAYSMQMRARREELHALAMKALERLHAGEIEGHYDELAYHADRAEDRQKAHAYYSLAAKASAASYGNAHAIECLTRALDFAPEHDLETRFALLADRVELYSRLGDRSRQKQDLEALENLAHQIGDSKHLASVNMLYVQYCFSIGDYPGVLERAVRVVSAPDVMEFPETALGVFAVWCLALLRLGRLDEAMKAASSGVELARETGNRVREGYILNAMGLIALEQRQPTTGKEYFNRALAIARETGDLNLELRCWNNLGNSAGYIEHDYVSARRHYEQAFSIAQKRGDRSAEGITLSNLGWTAGMQGDFDAARSYYQRSLLIAREVGNLYHETYTLINLSALTGCRGEAEESLEYARSARQLSVRSGERSGEAWSWMYEGYALLALGRLDEARYAFRQSVAIREELAQPGLMMEPIAGLIHLALREGDRGSAFHHAERILSHLADGGTLDGVEEPLRVYHACYQALEQNGDPRAGEMLRQAAQLLETQTAVLPDEKMRRMYVENVPWRLAIHEAWRAAMND